MRRHHPARRSSHHAPACRAQCPGCRSCSSTAGGKTAPVPLFSKQQIIRQIGRIAPLARGPGGDAVLRRRLVVRRSVSGKILSHCDTRRSRPDRRHASASSRCPQRRVTQRRDLLLERQIGDRGEAGRPRNGFCEISKPSRMPVGRVSTWPSIGTPAALASAIQPVIRRHSSGLLSRCRMVIAIGRPAAAVTRRSMANSGSGIIEIADHLQPAGIDRPQCPRDRGQFGFLGRQRRDQFAGLGLVVDRPRRREPQRTRLDALRRNARHGRGISIGRRLSLHATLAHHEYPHRRMRNLRRDIEVDTAGLPAHRGNPGNDCQFHGSPSVSTGSGISSTPSISRTSMSRSSGRHGAKPTPQLPISVVVTPCHDDGVIRLLHVAWAS